MKQSHNNARSLSVSLALLLLLSLTGCWSSTEIEQRDLIVGAALDKGEELTDKAEYQEGNLITLTFQFVTPQESETEQQKSYLNVSETGSSIDPADWKILLRRERDILGQHQKLMVIGADLAREVNLQQLLDLLFRDNDIRPSCLVFISNGRASETLESKETGEIPSFRLLGIANNENRTTRILPPMPLAKLEGKMHSGSSFLLQNIISSNGEVKFAGAAVIEGKTKKLLGFLDEEELEGLMWITGTGKGGLVKSFDEETGQLIIYEVKSMKSRITPHIEGNNISFDVNIESEGRLSENWVVSGNPTENKFLKRAEKATEEEVNRLVNKVLEKIQKEYQVDVAGFGNRLRIEHPKVWEKIKKDWDKTFSEIPIKYNVNLTITDYGASGSNK
ncbi:MAG: Ger(x)C family spore germination protein [Bacillota bacterium]